MTPQASKECLEWAISYLSTNQIASLKQKKLIHTSYSEVHQIETTHGIFYLKQVPEALFLEPRMLSFLQEQGCDPIPQFIAKNNTLHCFLMTSCGDISLRHLFKGQVDLQMLSTGIINYTKIQRSLENQTPKLLKIGVLDWRLNQFASLYYKLLQQEQLLIDDGLTSKEIEQLQQLYPACSKLCMELAQYRVPETLNHCDFHENNMLLDQKTGAISIIDWGEIVLSHPFFSLCGCLWNITYFHKISTNDLQYLKAQCVTAWLDLYEINELLHVLNTANQLNGIYAALSYEQMYRATQNKLNSVQQEHKGSIAGCLRTFYNNLN
jgi:thiamine kinase-like enzyme